MWYTPENQHVPWKGTISIGNTSEPTIDFETFSGEYTLILTALPLLFLHPMASDPVASLELVGTPRYTTQVIQNDEH